MAKVEQIKRNLLQQKMAAEVLSVITPEGLANGKWWDEKLSGTWPQELCAGLLEPRRGYRFRPENLALAHCIGRSRGADKVQRVVDLGSGSGSLLLIAWYLINPRRAVGVELQSEAVERLNRTITAHGIEGARCLLGDLREEQTLEAVRLALEGPADLVVVNPPFFPAGWGRASSDSSTHHSTHSLQGDVAAFLTASAALLNSTGRVWLVYDAQRLAEVMAAAGMAGLRVEQFVWIGDQRPECEGKPFRIWLALARDEQPKTGAYISRLC